MKKSHALNVSVARTVTTLVRRFHLLVVLGAALFGSRAAEAAILLGNQPDPTFAGLKVWYDAGSITDGEGNPVTTWNSSDANPNSATGAGSRRPLWTANGLNGQPTVQFDGADDQLIMADDDLFQTANHPNTYFAILTTSAANAHVIGRGSSSSGFLNSFGSGLIMSSSRATAKANQFSSGVFLQATTTNYSTGRLITAVLNGTLNEIQIDGVQEATSNSAINAWPYTRATLGASDGDGTGVAIDPFAGAISEILVYGALTTEEIDQVNQYLFDKYFVPQAVAAIPEPSTLLLLASGAIALVTRRARRKSA